jgi:3-oxoacyl-[acyl-carrier-protein] synthase II
MSRRVVVTGLGLVLPGADTPGQFWQVVRSGTPQMSAITSFDPTGHANPDAGQVADAQVEAFNARLRKRMDRFCQFAMVAARSALAEAGLDATQASEATGVYIGNMFAGWQIAEPSMRALCQVGYAGVSPYIASAWFPTAAQGQISIGWGLHGYSKTVAADTASAAVAFGYAARAIREGRATVVLAGGAEAPITPYTSTFTSTSGRVTPGHYQPFTAAAAGFQVGEGSVIFVLEERGHALDRGAHIMAEVAGFATGHANSRDVFGTSGAEELTARARQALSEARTSPEQVDYVGLDAQGTVAADRSEAQAMRALLGRRAAHVTCSSAKPVTGHLLGAGPAVELASRAADADRPAATGPVRTAVVNARGADGTVAACVLHAA